MNANDPFDRFRTRVVRIRGWQIALVVAAAIAIGLALALVAASVFLVVFPIMIIAGAAYRLFGGRKSTRGTARGRPGVTIIEAPYRVVENERDPQGGPRR